MELIVHQRGAAIWVTALTGVHHPQAPFYAVEELTRRIAYINPQESWQHFKDTVQRTIEIASEIGWNSREKYLTTLLQEWAQHRSHGTIR